MTTDVLQKDLRDRRIPALGLGLGLSGMSVFALSIYSGMRETIDALAANFPEELTAFIGTDVPGGYVVGEVFDLIAPLTLVAYAIIGGAAAVAGEEERGTMALLSAQPLTRTNILASKALGLLAALLTATAIFAVGTGLAALAFDIGIGLDGVAASSVHLAALAVTFGSLSLLVGCATGRRDVAVAVVGVLAGASYVSASVLPLAGLQRWAWLSPWHYYSGSERLTSGIDAAHLLVLASLTAAAVTLAWHRFGHRDLRG